MQIFRYLAIKRIKLMQVKDTSKMYPCWRIYKVGEKLPKVSFHNGRTIDLSSKEVAVLLEQLPDNNLILFSDHLYYGRYQQMTGKDIYSFGNNFTVTKNDDGSVCVFGNGCIFE